jgi:hypothetical protein
LFSVWHQVGTIESGRRGPGSLIGNHVHETGPRSPTNLRGMVPAWCQGPCCSAGLWRRILPRARRSPLLVALWRSQSREAAGRGESPGPSLHARRLSRQTGRHRGWCFLIGARRSAL